MRDEHGDRMKFYEKQNTHVFDRDQPIYVRIDGRSFSKFTKGMERPYDYHMSMAMINTMKGLVEKTNATIGYTQSDEISLMYYNKTPESQFMFGGKSAKLHSVLASLATALFTKELYVNEYLHNYIDRLPHFDCRVCQIPYEEAANMFTWRYKDATRNAIQSAAGAVFSHRELQNKNTREMLEMLEKVNISFNNLPTFFTHGTFASREMIMSTLTNDFNDNILHVPTMRTKVTGFTIKDFVTLPYPDRQYIVFNKKIG